MQIRYMESGVGTMGLMRMIHKANRGNHQSCSPWKWFKIFIMKEGLKTSRREFDMEQIMHFLQERNIHQLYIIGGDGTHLGAYAINQECVRRDMEISICGIPKTVDNDKDYVYRVAIQDPMPLPWEVPWYALRSIRGSFGGEGIPRCSHT